MSEATINHPDPERLLRYLDGDLDPPACGELTDHLSSCAACRLWLKEIETGVREYSHDWMPALQSASPHPPAAWFDLRAQLEQIDRGPVRKQLQPPARRLPRWFAAAAAVVLTLAGGYWFSARPMSAAELLRQASEQEAKSNTPRRPIRIAARAGTVIRPALWRASGAVRLPAAERAHVESLEALFRAANYSWDDPLSARSLTAWRATLADSEDRTRKRNRGDGVSTYEIATTTDSGTLAEVRLEFRIPDLHAVHGTLFFRGQDAIEITELTGDLPAAAPLPPPPLSVAQSGGESSGSEREAAPESLITPLDELQVWAALHRAGADLGEPIEVKRDTGSNSIQVTAMGLSPGRRKSVEQALVGMPRVHLQFREPERSRSPSSSLPSEDRTEAPALRLELESRLGSHDAAEEFTNRVTQTSESTLLRAHALRELAAHFPVDVEAKLDGEGRRILASLLQSHFSQLQMAVNRMTADMRQAGIGEAAAPSLPAESWQEHSRRLVAGATAADQAMTKALVIGNTGVSQEALTSGWRNAQGRMEAEVAAAAAAFRSQR